MATAEFSKFASIIFKIFNCSGRTPSPPKALFIVLFPGVCNFKDVCVCVCVCVCVNDFCNFEGGIEYG